MFCTKCGRPLPDDAKFCVYCGQPVLHENIKAESQEHSSGDTDQYSNSREDPGHRSSGEDADYGYSQEDLDSEFENPKPASSVVDSPSVRVIHEEREKEANAKEVYEPSDIYDQDGKKVRPHKSHKKLVAGIIVALAAAAVIGGFYYKHHYIDMGHETVDLTSCLTEPEFEGYSGEGTLAAAPSLDADVLQAMIEDAYGKDAEHYRSDADDVVSAVSISVEPTENLSNGDEVTINLEYNKDALRAEYDLSFTGTAKKVTVAGLTELEEKDPFSGLALVFSGVAPNTYVALERDQNGVLSELADSAYYSINRGNETLSEDSVVEAGDELRIVFNEDGISYWREGARTPTRDSVTYTVREEDVDTYVYDYEKIDADVKAVLQNESKDRVTAYLANQGQILSPDYTGTFVFKPKNGTENAPYMVDVYHLTIATDEGTSEEYLTVSVPAVLEDRNNIVDIPSEQQEQADSQAESAQSGSASAETGSVDASSDEAGSASYGTDADGTAEDSHSASTQVVSSEDYGSVYVYDSFDSMLMEVARRNLVDYSYTATEALTKLGA